MAYLHNDREQFKDAIYLAYDQTGIMVQAIEKDYYVTMLLKLLSEKIPYIVFKGGTSLSKCHKVIPLAYSMKFQGLFKLIEYKNVVDLQKLSTKQALEETRSLVLNMTKLENDVEHSMMVCKKYKSITKNQLKFAILDTQNKRK